MKKIDLNAPPETGTFLIYGDTRSGKTKLAGTFPRPRFLSDQTEKGYETLRHMKPEELFEPGVRPEVYGIESPKDMIDLLEDTEVTVRKNPGKIQTLVIDSLTFYSDLFYETMAREEARMSGQKMVDTRKLYGALFNHLRSVMIRAHSIPGINVVWLGLASVDDYGRGGLMIPGKSAAKLPAMCNNYWYLRRYKVSKDEEGYEVRTQTYMSFPAGGRDGEKLPDPLPENSYRAYAQAMGIVPNNRK